MIHVTREAALSQVRIAVQIFGRLDNAGGKAIALQQHHQLMRRVLARPCFDLGIELVAVDDARRGVGKARVGEPFAVTDAFAKSFPFFLLVYRNHAPAIVAFAAVAAMGRRGRAEVSLGFGLAAVDQQFQ